jgi:hypothetical protein
MKSLVAAFLILLTLTLSHCQKEEEYWKTSNDFKFFVLREILWKQGHCPAPNLVLEKGVSYNVILKAGERFWFDFKERQEADQFKFKNYTLTVSKQSSDKIGSRSGSCASTFDSNLPLYTGVEISAVEIQLKYTENGNRQRGFFLESISENSSFSINHSNTENLQ